jgi:very-short-patch-repair endonuclease
MERSRDARAARKRPHSTAKHASVGRQPPSDHQNPPSLVRILGHRGLLRVAGDREQRVGAIARLQRGRVTRTQLLSAGLTSNAINHMLHRGLLQAEHAGVYLLRSAPPVPWGRETSALLACHGGAILSHRSAAAVWGLIPAPDGPVDVTVVDGDGGRKRAGIRVHRTARLLARDTTVHEGLPITSAARTLLDLSSCESPRVVERAIDDALVLLKIVRPKDLEDVAGRARHRRGAALFRGLLSTRKGGTLTESQAEQRFLALIREAELPLPETQVPFNGFRIDFLWRDVGVVFEIDGHRYHSSRRAFNRDRRKDAALKAAALDPNHLARDEVEFRPLYVIGQVASALARARRARGDGL